MIADKDAELEDQVQQLQQEVRQLKLNQRDDPSELLCPSPLLDVENAERNGIQALRVGLGITREAMMCMCA